MNYVFFGSPEFAKIILEKLISVGMSPALVVCNPDKPFGRKKIVTPPPTKEVALKNNIPVWQPESLRNPNIWKSDFQIFDFFIVAAYAKIIPADILKIPKLGTIGVHPSLLPKYRGATPIQSVILNGEKETGVTLYLMDEKMDHGDTLATRVLPIANRVNYETLMCELAEASSDLLVETIPKFINKKITPVMQDHSQATFTKKFETTDGLVDLVKDDPVIIDRKVRALNPDPGVYTFMDSESSPSLRSGRILPEAGKIRIKLLETSIENGQLKLIKVQLDGKKPTSAQNISFSEIQ